MSSPFVEYPKPVCSNCRNNSCNNCEKLVIKYNELARKYNNLLNKYREFKQEMKRGIEGGIEGVEEKDEAL